MENLDIKFKTQDTPKVSIIIPVYNQLDYTLMCLKSLYKVKEETAFEIILIDDCSTDDTEKVVSQITGIIYHRNKVNQGFLRNINIAAKIAKGEYLFLLNNDTEVKDHFLKYLLDVFERFPKAATVGSKLIYPDGVLQEAGSQIYKNGAGFNYGKYQNANDFRYNFVREVHYCSGAALMIDRKIFFELNMFDEDLAPAYYEDSDFQIRAQKAGYTCFYQPKSVVVHYEGVSNGKDLGDQTVGVKKYQLVNKEKFFNKHKDYLEKISYDPADSPEFYDFIFAPKNKPHLYFIDDLIPAPTQDSGSQRCFNLLMLLKEKFTVTFIPACRLYNESECDLLTQNGIRVLLNPDNSIIDLNEFFKKNQNFPKYIVVSRPDVAFKFFGLVKKYNSLDRIIYDTVDIAYLRWKIQLSLLNHSDSDYQKQFSYIFQKYQNHRSVETYVIKQTPQIWVVSEDEKKFLIDSNLKIAADITVVPNIYEPNPIEGSYDGRKNMLFIGGFGHTPNLDAIYYYQNSIIPELKKRNLKIKLHVIGNKQELAKPGIKESEYLEFMGYVEDPAEYFKNCLMAFYPLRFGAGMKGKVTQAMALGLPIVTTDIGAQGYINASEYMNVGNSVSELVDGIQKYLENENLWSKNREKSVEYIKDNLSMDAVSKVINKL